MHIGVGSQLLSPCPVKIAGDCQKSHDRAVILQSVPVMAQGRGGLIAAHPWIFMNQPGGGFHLVIGYSGYGLYI